MKYVKILGLLAVAAAALMAFTASASANTTLTSPAGTNYLGTIEATNEEPLTLHGPVDVTCTHSRVHGHAEKPVGETTVKGPITTLTFDDCHDNVHITVTSPGTLQIHTKSATADGNGTLTSSGATVVVVMTTIFGNITCNYLTNNTDIGTLTGSKTTGKTATLDIEAFIPVESGSGLCGSSAQWTGKYVVTSPDYLDVD